jgi:hypothetical protein
MRRPAAGPGPTSSAENRRVHSVWRRSHYVQENNPGKGTDWINACTRSVHDRHFGVVTDFHGVARPAQGKKEDRGSVRVYAGLMRDIRLVLKAKRIQGQVEALVRVLTEERDCSEVLQVMSAARGATIVMLASGAILSLTRDGRKRATGRSAVRARYIP